MTEKYYDIYFEPSDLEVDSEGHLVSEKPLYILEYDENGKVLNRVNTKGQPISFGDEPLEGILSLYHRGEGDDTLKGALKRFWDWLDANLEWRESSRQTYWQPAEYVCIGLTGHCGYDDMEDDDDAMEWYRLRLHW